MIWLGFFDTITWKKALNGSCRHTSEFVHQYNTHKWVWSAKFTSMFSVISLSAGQTLFGFGSKCINIIAKIITFFPPLQTGKKKTWRARRDVSQFRRVCFSTSFEDADWPHFAPLSGFRREFTLSRRLCQSSHLKSRRFICFARLNISFWWANWFRIWLALLRGTERMPPLLTHDLPSPPWRGRSPVCNSYSKFSRVPLAPFFITMRLKQEREREKWLIK